MSAGFIGDGARASTVEEEPEFSISAGARSSVIIGKPAQASVPKSILEEQAPVSYIGDGARSSIRDTPPPPVSYIGDGARSSVTSATPPEPKYGEISYGAHISGVSQVDMEKLAEDDDDDDGGEEWEMDDPLFSIHGHVDTTGAVRRARTVLRKSVLANSTNLLEREVLKEVIWENRRRWTGCLMLPVTILFFTFFSASVSLHEDITYNYLMESPIRAKFLPRIDDVVPEDGPDSLQGVNTIDDLWFFLEETLVPYFFNYTDSFGRTLPKSEWGTFERYNKVLAGVVMTLQRSEKERCKDDFSKHMWCYPMGTHTSETFGAPLSDLAPLTSNMSYYNPDGPAENNLLTCADEGFSTAGCGAEEERAARRLTYLQEEMLYMMPAVSQDENIDYVFKLSTSLSREEILERIAYLKHRGWLDEQATTLRLQVVILNAQLHVPRLEMVTLSFFFSRGGGVYAMLRMEAFALQQFGHAVSYLVDFLFFVMLVASSIQICRSAFHDMFHRKVCHFTGVNIVTHLTCVVGWFALLGLLGQSIVRKGVKTAFQDYMDHPEDGKLQTKLVDAMDMATWIGAWVRLFVADAHILFMCRCFIFLQWQPRLAVVTQTLVATASDLFHYMIVLVPTFFAFAIAGMMMFGRRLQEFATLQHAIASCFKISMENEFGWRGMSEQDFWTAATWVWIYVLLVVMLLLNMVLAIIVDVYQDVRMHSGESMTIFEHILYLYRCFSKRKQWVGDEQLIEQVGEMPQVLHVAELKQAFPDMHHFQLDYLVSQTFNKALAISRVGINQRYTAQMVAAIHLGLEEALHDLNQMRDRGWMGKNIEVHGDRDRELVKDVMTSIAVQTHWMGLAAKHIAHLTTRVQGVDHEDDEATCRFKKAAMKSVFTKKLDSA